MREALTLSCYFLDRAASALTRGADEDARAAVTAAGACDLLARRLLHRLAHAVGESRLPQYQGPVALAVLVQRDIDGVMAALDVDLGTAEGPETIRSKNTIEESADALLPLLSGDRSAARVFGVAAACLGALREGVSPRAWLERFSRLLPDDRDEPRDVGTLAANPDAVRVMARAASRLRDALDLDADGTALPGEKRGPYAQLFDITPYRSDADVSD